jgi:hypothetical protein
MYDCKQCFELFDNSDQLISHMTSGRDCSPLPGVAKPVGEYINVSQWDRIVNILKSSGQLDPAKRETHDIERWFKIWDVLFPGETRPPHPCKLNINMYPFEVINRLTGHDDEQSDRPGLEGLSIEGQNEFIMTVDRIIRFNSERGLLNFDHHSHQCYLTAIRQALGLEVIISPPFAAQLSRGLGTSTELQTWTGNSALINTPYTDGGECSLFTPPFSNIESPTVSHPVVREDLQPDSVTLYPLASSGSRSHNHVRKLRYQSFRANPQWVPLHS